MGDWSWFWYLSNYWQLNLHECTCWKLVSTQHSRWWNLWRQHGVEKMSPAWHARLKSRPHPPKTDCLCVFVLRFSSLICETVPESMLGRDQGRLVICDKAFIFQLLQEFSETWSQNHGFTSFLLFVQFSSQCNIWSCVCVCCFMCWLAW